MSHTQTNQLVFLSQSTWFGQVWAAHPNSGADQTPVLFKTWVSLHLPVNPTGWRRRTNVCFQKCRRKVTLTRWSCEIFPPHRTESLRLSWCEITPKLWLWVLIKLSLCLSLQFGSCVKPGLFLPDFPISCDCCENRPLHKRLGGGFLVLDLVFCGVLAPLYRKGLQELSQQEWTW